jgi:PhnB protein
VPPSASSIEHPKGRVMHAEVQIGDSVVMLGEANDEWGGFKAMIHLYMPDVDAVFRRAVDAGGRVVREVGTQDYGDRTGGVEDPQATSGGSPRAWPSGPGGDVS